MIIDYNQLTIRQLKQWPKSVHTWLSKHTEERSCYLSNTGLLLATWGYNKRYFHFEITNDQLDAAMKDLLDLIFFIEQTVDGSGIKRTWEGKLDFYVPHVVPIIGGTDAHRDFEDQTAHYDMIHEWITQCKSDIILTILHIAKENEKRTSIRTGQFCDIKWIEAFATATCKMLEHYVDTVYNPQFEPTIQQRMQALRTKIKDKQYDDIKKTCHRYGLELSDYIYCLQQIEAIPVKTEDVKLVE